MINRVQVRGTVATYTAYAEAIDADSPLYGARAQHSPGTLPGRLLQSVLDETGGRYEISLPIPDDIRQRLRRLAALSGDAALGAKAEVAAVTVSFEHLRGADPATTRVAIGHHIDYTLDEARALGLRDPDFAARGRSDS